MDMETRSEKAFEEPRLVNSFDQACDFASYIPCTHADLARAEARSSGSGSRPIQMDYGSKCDEGSSSDGNDGSQGGSSVNSFREERNGMKKRSNFGNTGTKSGTMEKNLAHMELQSCGRPCEAEENAIGPGMPVRRRRVQPMP
ncbi:hypothetical protein ACSQ67_016729 [Phaseolus vulgaris]